MSRLKRFITITSEQGNLLPVYISELIPEDHFARVVQEIVEALASVRELTLRSFLNGYNYIN